MEDVKEEVKTEAENVEEVEAAEVISDNLYSEELPEGIGSTEELLGDIQTTVNEDPIEELTEDATIENVDAEGEV